MAEASGITQSAAKQQTRVSRKAKGKTKVATDGIDVQTIRTMGKYIPQRLRDALEAAGICCVVRGCRRTKGLQIDHTAERRDGGATELRNFGWLCPYHLRLKTMRRYDLWRDEQRQWHWEPRRTRAPN